MATFQLLGLASKSNLQRLLLDEALQHKGWHGIAHRRLKGELAIEGGCQMASLLNQQKSNGLPRFDLVRRERLQLLLQSLEKAFAGGNA